MSTAIGRRGFVASAAAAAGMTAMATSAVTAKAEQGEEDAWDYEADVVVAGSGLGGYAAALSAMDSGARVVIAEISGATGGGTAFSGADIHMDFAYESIEQYDSYSMGIVDRTLGHAYWESFHELTPWLLGKGLALTDKGNGNGAFLGTGDKVGMKGARDFFDSCDRLFESQGGTLLLGTAAEHVIREGGETVGLQCVEVGSGSKIRVKAPAVVLATGGFQADSGLRARFLGEDACMCTVTAVPYATGAGLRMAEECGAAVAGGEGFSSLWQPARPATNPMEDAAAYEAMEFDDDGKYSLWMNDAWSGTWLIYHGGILVNLNGERFFDEDSDASPHMTARQYHATALLIAGDALWQEWIASPTSSGRTIGEYLDEVVIGRQGGVVYEAGSLEALADILDQDGPHKTPRANLIRTIEEYNEAVGAGKGRELRIPRTLADAAPLEPPLHAYPVTPGIYAPFTGVAIDADARVLDANRRPIPGLFATFPCAGGMMNERYIGAIACAGVTGRWAGAAAAANALG